MVGSSQRPCGYAESQASTYIVKASCMNTQSPERCPIKAEMALSSTRTCAYALLGRTAKCTADSATSEVGLVYFSICWVAGSPSGSKFTQYTGIFTRRGCVAQAYSSANTCPVLDSYCTTHDFVSSQCLADTPNSSVYIQCESDKHEYAVDCERCLSRLRWIIDHNLRTLLLSQSITLLLDVIISTSILDVHYYSNYSIIGYSTIVLYTISIYRDSTSVIEYPEDSSRDILAL
jgi:hypothetical protein